MKRVLLCLAAAMLCGFSTLSVWGQATAQISGTVRDTSGAVLPGVEVTLTQTDTGIARNMVSNETGSYAFSNLAVGPYKLAASLPGFRTFVQTGIILQVNSSPVINATLEVGQVNQQIEVQANAALVETRTTSVGQVIENARILELPLNGRNTADLIVYAGAAVPLPSQNSSSRSFQGQADGVAYSVAGGLAFGVTYMLDGAMHNNPYDNLNLPLPFPDALQEFKLETSTMTANQGMHSGASVTSVTKSGANEFHGDFFEFVRNYKFNARDYFALKRDSLKRNQFGGTIGGPINKNRLFFFGGYQATITRQDPSDSISYVPTPAVLAGDWSAMASAACAGTARTLRSVANTSVVFNNNRIDRALYSLAAMNIAARLPKSDDPCGKINVARINRPSDSQYIGKIDYQESTRHSMFGRIIETTLKTPPPHQFTENVLATSIGGRDNLAQSYTFGDTYLLNSNTVNAVRIAINRTAIHRTSKDFFSAPEVGVNTFSYMPHYSLFTVNNFFSIGGGTESESTFRTTTYQLGEDLSLTRRTHRSTASMTAARKAIRAACFPRRSASAAA